MKCVDLHVVIVISLVISLRAEHIRSVAGDENHTACASKFSQAAESPANGRSYLQKMRRLSAAAASSLPGGGSDTVPVWSFDKFSHFGWKFQESLLHDDHEFVGKCPNGGRWETVTCKSLGWNASTHNRKIYDGFAYNGEVDMFWARKRELEQIVDGTAILVTEANFKGVPHTLAAIPSDDVKHLVLPGSAFNECRSSSGQVNSRCAVSMTKNSVASALELFNLSLEDWIIFGDVDEIPNREFVRLLKECDVPDKHDVLHLSTVSHFMYDTGCKVKHSQWTRNKNLKTPVVMKVKAMRKYGLRLHQAYAPPYCTKNGPYAFCLQQEGNRPHDDEEKAQFTWYMDELSGHIPCAMWHLSSFGGMELLQRKVSDNSDRANAAELAHDARECKEENKDRRGMGMARTTHSATKYPEIPHSVAENPQRFSIFTTPSL
jgi:hypothetical protein